MTVQLLPFAPRLASEREWAMYHRFRRVRHQERDPDDPLLDDRTTEKLMRRRDPEWESLYFAAIEEEAPDALLGWVGIDVTREGALTHETNGHMAWADVEILAPHRRQGIGRTLLAKAVEIARERGRTLLVGGTKEADGRGFIEAMGGQVAQRWRESRLHLDQVDWDMIERWVEEGQTRSPNTTLRFFTNYLDDALVEDFCEVLQEVSNQEPRGDLEVGDEFVTPEILKERVDSFVNADGTLLRAITQEASGKIGGLTVMGYFPEEKTLIHQYMTGVKDVYRGRGLGKWVKAAMLLRVRQEFPQVKIVITGNATSNAAMLSINRRLGFKPYRDGVEAQIRLDAVEAYLAK